MTPRHAWHIVPIFHCRSIGLIELPTEGYERSGAAVVTGRVTIILPPSSFGKSTSVRFPCCSGGSQGPRIKGDVSFFLAMTTNPAEDSAKPAYTIAIVGGALLWLAATLVRGKREAWDSSLYWTVAYPLSIVLAGWLGCRYPKKPWRWGLSILLAQAVALAFTGGDYSMLPLGMILFAVLSLPAICLAYAGARLGSRKDE